jgi:quinolinate synthase
VLNTGGILDFARHTTAREIIVGMEVGILYRLRKENPDKIFIAGSERAVCRTMKMVTLESVMWSLDSMTHQVQVPATIRRKAKRALDRMLEV